MAEYLKCVWANKATLAGWVLLFGAILLLFFAVYAAVLSKGVAAILIPLGLCVLCTALGLCLLVLTGFGIETLDEYRRAYRVYRNSSSISPLVGRAKLRRYCTRVGIELALREIQSKNGRL